MKTVKYTVEIDMPDGDYISASWIEDDIKGNLIEDEDRYAVRVKIETLEPMDILKLINDTAEIIAKHYGNNVPYCESIDISLFGAPIIAITKQMMCEVDLKDLRFLASNERLLPKSLANGTIDDFQKYCSEHKQEILSEIQSECLKYQAECKED